MYEWHRQVLYLRVRLVPCYPVCRLLPALVNRVFHTSSTAVIVSDTAVCPLHIKPFFAGTTYPDTLKERKKKRNTKKGKKRIKKKVKNKQTKENILLIRQTYNRRQKAPRNPKPIIPAHPVTSDLRCDTEGAGEVGQR